MFALPVPGLENSTDRVAGISSRKRDVVAGNEQVHQFLFMSVMIRAPQFLLQCYLSLRVLQVHVPPVQLFLDGLLHAALYPVAHLRAFIALEVAWPD
jgi:hypothetical protein